MLFVVGYKGGSGSITHLSIYNDLLMEEESKMRIRMAMDFVGSLSDTGERAMRENVVVLEAPQLIAPDERECAALMQVLSMVEAAVDTLTARLEQPK